MCTVQSTLGAFSLADYLFIRICATAFSAVPVIYLALMVVHRVQQVANRREISNETWRKPWLTAMMAVEFLLSLGLMVFDGSVFTYLQNNWSDPAFACRLAEQNMLHYTSSVRVPLNTLPIALLLLSIPMTVWSVLFIFNEIRHFRR